MGIQEAKLTIAQEFITKYYEWLHDHNNTKLSASDYGRKYGWGRFPKPLNDTQKSVLWFQSHVFSGKYLPQWKAEGINPFELHRDGFLSYDHSSSYRARALGKADFFYISQAKAKEIYKAYKAGSFR